MRILKVDFTNLNSLNGHFIIDFTDKAYLDEGIFAITGPTGSGKTTILDAICLALYRQTPRQKSIGKGANEIMSRNTAFCESKVLFEVKGEQYTARFYQARAHKKVTGDLQNPIHVITKGAQDGTILEDKLNKTSAKVSEITGLDFDRFTKSMMLSQGNFASFLQSNKNERAPLLEQITGTNLYREISKAVYTKHHEEERKYQDQKLLLDGLELLPKEMEDELLKRKNELVDKIKDASVSYKELGEIEHNYKELLALKETLENLEKAIENNNKAIFDFAPYKEVLERFYRASELTVKVREYELKGKEIKDTKEALLENKEKKESLEATCSEKQKVLTLLNESKSAKDSEKESFEKIADEVVKLDSNIENTKTALTDKNNKKADLTKTYTKKKKALTVCDREINSLQEQITKTYEYLTANQNDEGLELKTLEYNQHNQSINKALNEDLTELKNKVSTCLKKLKTILKRRDSALTKRAEVQDVLEGIDKNISDLSAKKTDSQKLINKESCSDIAQKALTLENDYASLVDRFEPIEGNLAKIQHLQKEIDKLNQDLVKLEATVQGLLDMEAILDKRVEVLRRLDRINYKELLGEFAKGLHEGEPCPLCGSTTHPHITEEVANMAKVNLEHKIEDSDIKKAETEHKNTQKKLALAKEKVSECKATIQSKKEIIKNLEQSVKDEILRIIKYIIDGSALIKELDNNKIFEIWQLDNTCVQELLAKLYTSFAQNATLDASYEVETEADTNANANTNTESNTKLTYRAETKAELISFFETLAHKDLLVEYLASHFDVSKIEEDFASYNTLILECAKTFSAVHHKCKKLVDTVNTIEKEEQKLKDTRVSESDKLSDLNESISLTNKDLAVTQDTLLDLKDKVLTSVKSIFTNIFVLENFFIENNIQNSAFIDKDLYENKLNSIVALCANTCDTCADDKAYSKEDATDNKNKDNVSTDAKVLNIDLSYEDKNIKAILALIKDFKVEALASVLNDHLEALNARAQKYKELKETLVKDKGTCDLKAKDKENIQKELKRLDAEKVSVETEIETLQKELETIKAKRYELFSDNDVALYRDSLNKALTKLITDIKRADSAYNEAHGNLQKTISLIEKQESDLEVQGKSLTNLKTGLNEALISVGFTTLDDYHKAIITETYKKELESQQQNLNDKKKSFVAQKEMTQEKFTKLEQKLEGSPSYDEIVLKLDESKNLYESLLQEQGNIDKTLESQRQKREEQKAKLEELEAQKAIVERFERLDNLIGSANGDKYAVFVQNITFEYLVKLSNSELKKLTDRYILKVSSDRVLELDVIDTEQFSAIRPTSTLSGGETFLISLALALGLSKMASANVSVDSLFLDEGFGTLDDEALDSALNTLASLQREGKMIGIISHVEKLKERIRTQISVQKQNSGCSVLQGPGIVSPKN